VKKLNNVHRSQLQICPRSRDFSAPGSWIVSIKFTTATDPCCHSNEICHAALLKSRPNSAVEMILMTMIMMMMLMCTWHYLPDEIAFGSDSAYCYTFSVAWSVCLSVYCLSHWLLLLPFAPMYFSALMDSVILHLQTVLLLLLLHCLHCTVIQLFGYLHSRKCAK